MALLLLILGMIMFVGLVVLHEFGHFLAARRNGVVVEEFGIGFPPRAWKRKTKKGFIFSLNWLPIGGFVKLKGENDAADEPGSFGAAPFKTKTKIMLAGVATNLLIAFIIFTGLAWIGMPQLIQNQYTVHSDTKVINSAVFVGYVQPGSPADKGGLKNNDKLISIQGPKATADIKSANQLPITTKQNAGSAVKVTYEREGKRQVANVQLRTDKQAKGKAYLGISPADLTMTRATWSAPIQAVGLIGQITKATFVGIGTALTALFHGDGTKASEQVSGPVGIYAVLKQGSALGIQYVMLIIGIISLSLAIMNVLPIPALDGGRFYVLLLSRAFGKKLSKDMEERIVGASFVFLLLLIVVITIVDVKRFF
ncbi:MAG TPA: M50 family metallopeptidase [Candidatus Saccharimonadales bacterium]|jgi:regulator of sigma E protease|nr:M50 family metallopeptidase [Candidatus Saccharimonadales bacterium]